MSEVVGTDARVCLQQGQGFQAQAGGDEHDQDDLASPHKIKSGWAVLSNMTVTTLLADGLVRRPHLGAFFFFFWGADVLLMGCHPGPVTVRRRTDRATDQSPIGNRTLDLFLTMETLCRLSHWGAANVLRPRCRNH